MKVSVPSACGKISFFSLAGRRKVGREERQSEHLRTATRAGDGHQRAQSRTNVIGRRTYDNSARHLRIAPCRIPRPQQLTCKLEPQPTRFPDETVAARRQSHHGGATPQTLSDAGGGESRCAQLSQQTLRGLTLPRSRPHRSARLQALFCLRC